MGLVDALNAEDRVELKITELLQLVRGCAERDVMKNGINTDVPHAYMRMMITGKKEENIKEYIDNVEKN